MQSVDGLGCRNSRLVILALSPSQFDLQLCLDCRLGWARECEERVKRIESEREDGEDCALVNIVLGCEQTYQTRRRRTTAIRSGGAVSISIVCVRMCEFISLR